MAQTFVTTPLEYFTRTGTTYPKARAVSVTAGNLLFCFTWQYNNTQTCTGVSDTLGNTWVQAFGPIRGGAGVNNNTLYGWYAKNVSGGACTVTATWSGSGLGGILIGEVAGIAGGGDLDTYATNNVTANGPTTMGAGTTAALSGAVQAAVAVLLSSKTKTGQSMTADMSTATFYYENAQRTITSATTALTPTWDCSVGSGSQAAGVMVFKDAVSAPTFGGTIPTLTGTQGVAMAAQSPTIASYFTGTGITYTVSVALPTGLSIDGGTGVISGTPSTDADWSGTVTATNGGGAISSNTFAITIAAASSPVAFSGPVPAQSGTVGTAYTTLALAGYFSGSFTPFTYSVFSGALPGGLSLNTSTGEITGTPTTAGSFSAVVRATDTASNVANTGTISWTVAPAAATSMTVALKQNDGTTSAASVTGIEYAVLNASTLGAATAVLDTGTGESTDSSGNLVLDITGLGLVAGDVRYVVAGKSAGTVGADFDGWHGPAVAA